VAVEGRSVGVVATEGAFAGRRAPPLARLATDSGAWRNAASAGSTGCVKSTEKSEWSARLRRKKVMTRKL